LNQRVVEEQFQSNFSGELPNLKSRWCSVKKEEKMKIKTALILCSIIFVMSALVSAEETKTEKRWNDEAELSFVSTAGNSETTTFAGENLLKYKFTERLEGSWDIAGLYSEDNDIKTAERYSTNLQLKYLFTERLYSGLSAGWLKDEFVGFKNKYYVGPLIGYKFFTGPKHFLNGELGFNYTKEEYIDNSEEELVEWRTFGNYEYAISPKTKFSQSFEYLHDLAGDNNHKAISLTAVTVAITEIFSIKTGYEIRYVNRPVPDTLENTDSILTVALVANF
jgi:putative salt-induced outer membrane protein